MVAPDGSLQGPGSAGGASVLTPPSPAPALSLHQVLTLPAALPQGWRRGSRCSGGQGTQSESGVRLPVSGPVGGGALSRVEGRASSMPGQLLAWMHPHFCPWLPWAVCPSHKETASRWSCSWRVKWERHLCHPPAPCSGHPTPLSPGLCGPASPLHPRPSVEPLLGSFSPAHPRPTSVPHPSLPGLSPPLPSPSPPRPRCPA